MAFRLPPEEPAMPSPHAAVVLPRSRLPRFHAVLQRGVRVRATAGRSVAAFLTEELGLAPAYVRERIATVFLDGRVVDDLEGALLAPGARLVLSAAMPGLVGATLRRGGRYAAMRAGITRAPDAAPGAAGVARIELALFNLLLDEVGPAVLARGVLLAAAEARELAGEAATPPGAEAEVELRLTFA